MIYNSALAAWYCSGLRNPPPTHHRGRRGLEIILNIQSIIPELRLSGCHARPVAPGRGNIMEITLRDLPKIMGTQLFWDPRRLNKWGERGFSWQRIVWRFNLLLVWIPNKQTDNLHRTCVDTFLFISPQTVSSFHLRMFKLFFCTIYTGTESSFSPPFLCPNMTVVIK